MKIKIYPCPKCKAVANIDPKATNLICPQCGYCYKKAETIAYYTKGRNRSYEKSR